MVQRMDFLQLVSEHAQGFSLCSLQGRLRRESVALSFAFTSPVLLWVEPGKIYPQVLLRDSSARAGPVLSWPP
jgi:hypothetical protein